MRESLQSILSSAVMPQLQQASNAPLQPVPEEEMGEEFFQLDSQEDAFDEQAEAPNFQENLAENIASSTLDNIAQELLANISDDEESRRPWMEMIEDVRGQLGIGESSSYEEPFPGSSSVVYPIITTAQIQFQARALPEIFPNEPAKAVVIGESTPELEEQAERVADTLNYQIVYQDKGNKKDFRKMLWWLPLTGSTFRYVYHDPLRNINMVRFVPVEDLIVPYGTTSLIDAGRINHRQFDTKNDLLKLMNMGFYLEIPLTDDGDASIDEDNAAQKIRDESDGEVKTTNTAGKRALQEYYNVYTEYDLEGYEDIDEEGNPTGIGLPYVFTIHARTRKTMAIRRNWKEDDQLKLKRLWHVHYQYQEGPGFYGSGLPHLIGSLQEASTGALRAFGDSMAFSMLQAGWKLKDAKFSGSEVFSPGVFQDVDSTMDDINKAIKVANFQPPSPQVLQYIEMLDNKAQALVSTQNILTGDQSPQNSPVGSTLAIIEQAQKVITAQHKSLFESFSEELQILADLNYDFLPDEDTFKLPGKVGIMRRADFDGRVDVLPTADPSVASFQQKQAIDQACFQYSQMPQFAPMFRNGGYELLKRMLKNMMVPSIDEIVYTEQEVKQKQDQAAQNPPPPSPDEIKAQTMQQDAQVKAQTAQASAELEKRKLDIAEDKMLLDASLKAEENDIKSGTLNANVQQAADGFAIQQLQTVMQHHQAMQTQQPPVPPSAPQQPAPQPPPSPSPEEIAMMQQQAQSQPQANPEKRNMLMRIMDKIRGR